MPKDSKPSKGAAPSGHWITRDAASGRFLNSVTVDVVRSVGMPNGKSVRVMRKDAFDRALSRTEKPTK
jgi:hypothetical protein